MTEILKWDWYSKEKLIADIENWKKQFISVRDLIVSNDGQKI